MKNKKIDKLPLVIMIIVTSFIIILLSIFNFHQTIANEELKITQNYLKNEAKSESELIKNKFELMVSSLENLADFLEPTFFENNASLTESLRFIKPYTLFDFIGVANIEGDTIDSNQQSTNIAHRKYFQDTIKGNVSISEIMESAIIKDQIVQIISVPIYHEQKIVGICFGVFNIETLSKQVNAVKSNGAYLQIVDSEGVYITIEDQEDALKQNENVWDDMAMYEMLDQSAEMIQKDMEMKKSGFFRFRYQDEERVSYYQPLGIDQWYIFSTANQENINSQVSFTTKSMVQMLILMMVAVVLLMVVFVYLSKRAKEIERAAHLETKKKEEMLMIALEESKNSIFEYKQNEKKIILKGKIVDVFHMEEVENMPDSCMDYGVLCEDSYADCMAMFEEIKVHDFTTRDLKLRVDHQECWYRIIMKNIYDECHNLRNTIGVIANVDEQKRQKLELEENERIQSKLVSNALMTSLINLTTGLVKEKNSVKVEKELNYQNYVRNEIIPRIDDNNRRQILTNMSISHLFNEYKMGNDTVELVFQMIVEKKPIWVSCMYHIIKNEDEIDALMMINDINEKRSKEIELQKQAQRDGLTELYNAATLKSKVNEYLSSVQSLDGYQIFILMDLDNFKAINDTFGHAYGDQVLRDVAAILSRKFRRNDIVARLGGDEFVVMLMNVKDKDSIDRIYEELVEDLNLTYTEEDISITISASLGISIAPTHGSDFQTLYQKADKALYEAKKSNKNGYRIYKL